MWNHLNLLTLIESFLPMSVKIIHRVLICIPTNCMRIAAAWRKLFIKSVVSLKSLITKLNSPRTTCRAWIMVEFTFHLHLFVKESRILSPRPSSSKFQEIIRENSILFYFASIWNQELSPLISIKKSWLIF